MKVAPCLDERFVCIEGPLFFVSAGFSVKLIWSFYEEYILVHRAIPKSLRLEYLTSALPF